MWFVGLDHSSPMRHMVIYTFKLNNIVPYVIKPPSLMNEIEIFETKEPVGDIYNSKKFKFTRILD